MDLEALASAAIGLVVERCKALADRGDDTSGGGRGGDGGDSAVAPDVAAGRRLYELVDERLRGSYFSGVLARLCDGPADGDLAKSLQAALVELLRDDKRFATVVRHEVDQAQSMAAGRGDELTASQTSHASGNQVNIGTMRGGQFALGSIVNSRKVQISLGVGLPLLLLLLLFAIRRSDSEPAAGDDQGNENRQETAANPPRTTGDPAGERRNTTTATTPPPGEILWSWVPSEPLSQFEHASFADYTVIADFETDQLFVHDRLTGEVLDTRPLGDVTELKVVPSGTGGDWALTVYYETEIPANGLDPSRLERKVELYTDPTAPAVYSADLEEEQASYFTGSVHLVVSSGAERSNMTAYSVESGDTLWSSEVLSPASSTSSPDPVGRTTIGAYRVDTGIHAIVADTTGQALAEIPEEGGVVLAEPGTDVWQGYGQESGPTETVDYYFVMHGGQRGPNIPDPGVYSRIDAAVEAVTGILVMSYPDALVGYDGTTGEQVWSTEATFAGGIQDGLIHFRQDGRVVLRANDQIVVVDAATGEQLWASGDNLPPEDELELIYDGSTDLYDGGPTVSGSAEGGGLVFWYVGDQLPVARFGQTVLLAP